MAKLIVSVVATLFLALSFSSISASTIVDGKLIASNDKCGGDGACGGDKPKKAKCGDSKCGADSNKTKGSCGSAKCGDGKKKSKDGKCGEGKCGS